MGVAYGPKDIFFRGTIEIATDKDLTALVVQYMAPGAQLGFITLHSEFEKLKRAVPEFMYAKTPPYASIEDILKKEKAA